MRYSVIVLFLFLVIGCTFYPHDDNTQELVVGEYYLNFTPSASILIYKDVDAKTDKVVVGESLDSIGHNSNYIFAKTKNKQIVVVDIDSIKIVGRYFSGEQFEKFLELNKISKLDLEEVRNIYQ